MPGASVIRGDLPRGTLHTRPTSPMGWLHYTLKTISPTDAVKLRELTGAGMRTQVSGGENAQSPTDEAAVTADQGSLAKLVYTIDEVCQVVGISRATVYKEVKEQRLRVRKVGTRTLVPVDEVRAWLKT